MNNSKRLSRILNEEIKYIYIFKKPFVDETKLNKNIILFICRMFQKLLNIKDDVNNIMCMYALHTWNKSLLRILQKCTGKGFNISTATIIFK